MPVDVSPESTQNDADDQLVVQGDDANEPTSQVPEGDLGDGTGREDSTPATPDPGAPPTEEEPAWKRAFHEAGYQDVDSIDDVATRSIEAIQLRDEQNKQLAQELENMRQQMRFYQDQQGRQPLPQEDQAAQEQESDDLFDRLSNNWIDPVWARQYVEYDEEGNRHWVGEPDEETRTKVNQADKNLRDFQELFTDPQKFIAAIDSRIRHAAKQTFDDGWQERQSEAQQTAFRDRFNQENENWLYQHDPATGALVYDPVTREPILTQEGNQFVEYMIAAQDQGIGQFDRQVNYAMQMRELNQLRTGVPVGSQTAQQANDQQKRQMMARRNNGQTANSVNGVNPPNSNTPTGAQQMSYGERAMAAFKEQTGAA